MYCCLCGAKNPEDARYCHKCGAPIKSAGGEADPASVAPEESNPVPQKWRDTDEHEKLVMQLLMTDHKRNQCHRCESEVSLIRIPFGLARVLSTKRDWLGTAWSVAVSAVSIPLVGYGGLELPSKSSTLEVLRLELVLCEQCHPKSYDYTLHPWWHTARQLGYTRFLSEADLEKCRPT